MKKILLSLFLIISILTSCNTSELSFSEIENVPNDVQEKVDPNLTLQSINDKGKGYYIVYNNSGEVEAKLETEGDTLIINFDVTNVEGDNVKQNTFYLTTAPEQKVLDVHVNGTSIPFDNMTIY